MPDAEAVVTGLHQIELVLLLAESAGFQGDDERWYELVRRAVDMLDRTPSRCSRAGSTPSGLLLPLPRGPDRREGGHPTGAEYAGESPSEELARALLASAWQQQFAGHFGVGLKAVERATEVAEEVGRRSITRDDEGLRPRPCTTWVA